MSSFGEELRRERELRSISLREVAEATKVNVRYLEAIERNQFDQLPGGVFNRGFVRAYAEFIGVDPETMVNAYLLEEQSKAGSAPKPKPELLRGDRERRTARTSPAKEQERKERQKEKKKEEEEETPRTAPRSRLRVVGLWIFVVLVVAGLVLLGVWASGLSSLEGLLGGRS
jgi:cytoskeletal protein RodZ